MPERGDDSTNVSRTNGRPRDLHDVSRAVLRSEQARRWTKRYRTEVAASSSSLLSTFVAVSVLANQELPGIYAASDSYQYPLDSVKTRLQAYATPPPRPIDL
jgi:hypothetical protein